jgi:hypothetical protein
VRKEKREATVNMVNDFKKHVKKKNEIQDMKKSIEELLKFKIKCEDFWLRENDDLRRERLFKKMHPLIFLKEDQPAYVKIQNNWVFQFLTINQKKEYLKTRIPEYMPPSKENYTKYLDRIKDYTSSHPNE